MPTEEEKEIMLEECECIVCYEVPQRPVYQCHNGHIICKTCYPKMKIGCSTCQVKLQKNKPIRNLLMEHLLPGKNEVKS